MIQGLPDNSALRRSLAVHPDPTPAPPKQQRVSSSPEAIRRAGGRFVHAPKGGD